VELSAKSGRRAVGTAGVLALVVIGAITIAPRPGAALPPAQTVFVNEGFLDASAGPNYLLPNAPASTPPA
jgi:hypothetical protein